MTHTTTSPASAGRRLARAALVAAISCATALVGAAGLTAAQKAQPATATPPAVQLPPAGGPFDYQLGGSSPVPPGATVVARDSTDPPADGVYGICYVNGFQTQPGVTWPRKLLVQTKSGRLLVDPGWPDEHLFDLRKASTRRAVARRLGRTIEGCAASGYRAVEFDNLDAWTRSRGAYGKREAVAYAKLLVARAHAVGLAAAQKNTAELGSTGHTQIGFDFAVTEECDRFRECDAFTAVYGSLVFDIEYTDDLRGSAADVCARAAALQPAPSMIVRDRDLVPASSSRYAYTAC